MDFDKDDELTDAEYVPEKEDTADESETDLKPIRKSMTCRSETWKYFNRSEEDKKSANCKICGKEVPFHTVSELKFHILSQHGTIDHSDGVCSDGDKEGLQEQEQEHQASTKRKNRSEAWKYFDMKDPDKKIATCKICKGNFSYQTTSNLKKHVIRSHSKILIDGFSNDDQKEQVVVKRPSRSRYRTQFKSTIWKVFDVVDAKAKLARCKLCCNNFSYNCFSNLKKHTQRKHKGVLEGLSSDEEVEEQVEMDVNPAVWAYFKCIDEVLKIASCLICKKRVEYNEDSDLSKHLRRKHPRVDLEGLKAKPRKLMITENGDIFEIDDDVVKQESVPVTIQAEDDDSNDWPYDTSEIDAINTPEYSNEEILVEPTHVVSSKKRPKLSNRRTSNIRLQQTNQDDFTDTLDIFGKYIVSLMKKLPKHKSDKLQADFVRQIMEAQLNYRDQNSYKSPSIQNTRYTSESMSIDTRVTSNSGVKKVITTDGVIQDAETSTDLIVTSIGEEITVTTEN